MQNVDFIPFLNQTSTAQDPCPHPTDPGINFCVPASGDKVSSPVHFVGSFHAQTQPANRIELWIDDAKQTQVFSDRIDISVPVSTGIHTATLVGVDATGALIKSSQSFTVQDVPTSPGISICTPVSSVRVVSPTHIAASAAPPAGHVITAMRIYVDNQAELTVSGNTISGDVDLPEGKHTLVVVAWDNTSAAQTSTVNFTVNASVTPCLPFGPGLRVCTPAPGETVDSPVGIEAGAIPMAQRITAIRVYVNDAVAYFASNTEPPNSQSIGVALLMAAGSHHLVIVAYQNKWFGSDGE